MNKRRKLSDKEKQRLQDEQDLQDFSDLTFDGQTTKPEYTGPALMTDEYCDTPHFTTNYKEALALKYAMAEKCVNENREVVFIRGINANDIDLITKDGQTQSMPLDAQKGDCLRFTAEAKNPKTGEWKEKKFNILTAERSAMVDGALIIEGTKQDGTPYTLSTYDFSEELNNVLEERGLKEQEQIAPVFRDTTVPTEPTLTEEEQLEMIGLETEEFDPVEAYEEPEEIQYRGVFERRKEEDDTRPYLDDPELGRIY